MGAAAASVGPFQWVRRALQSTGLLLLSRQSATQLNLSSQPSRRERKTKRYKALTPEAAARLVSQRLSRGVPEKTPPPKPASVLERHTHSGKRGWAAAQSLFKQGLGRRRASLERLDPGLEGESGQKANSTLPPLVGWLLKERAPAKALAGTGQRTPAGMGDLEA